MRLMQRYFSITMLWCFSVLTAAQDLPDGEQLYLEQCASCHNGSLPLMPGREALRGLDPRAIVAAMTAFSMRRQASSLTAAERRAIAIYLTDAPRDSFRPPLEELSQSAYCDAGVAGERVHAAGTDWNGWGADLNKTRYQPTKAGG